MKLVRAATFASVLACAAFSLTRGDGCDDAYKANAESQLAVTKIDPSYVVRGTKTPLELVVAGRGFARDSTVLLGHTPVATTFVAAGVLRATIPIRLLATADLRDVSVQQPDGATSTSVALVVSAPGAPTLKTVNPSSATVGAKGVAVTVEGTGFIQGTTAALNGKGVSTIFNSQTSLTVTVDSALLAAGTFPLTVTNPNGGPSVPLLFDVASSLAANDDPASDAGDSSDGQEVVSDGQDTSEAGADSDAPEESDAAEGGKDATSGQAPPTLTTNDLLRGRCLTAICPAGIFSPGWLGIEPLVELPIGKTFTFNNGGLADYVNNTGVGVNFAAGLRVWLLKDWVSVSVYLSQPVTPQDSHVTVPGSSFQYPASYIRRPYPGIGLGFLYDTLWLGIDRDELHNGSQDSSSFRNLAFPPNALVSGVWTWTIAIQPITTFRTGIGTALSKKPANPDGGDTSQ